MIIESLIFGALFSFGSEFLNNLFFTEKIGNHTVIDFNHGKKIGNIQIKADSILYISGDGEHYFQQFSPGEYIITNLSNEQYVVINIEDTPEEDKENLFIKDIQIKNRRGKTIETLSFGSDTDYLYSILSIYKKNDGMIDTIMQSLLSFNAYKIFILEREIPTGIIDISSLDDLEYENLIEAFKKIRHDLIAYFECNESYKVTKINSQIINRDEPSILAPYFHILELDLQDNSPQQIKKQYKKLSKKYHPDTDSGDSELFDLVQTSYQFLNTHYNY